MRRCGWNVPSCPGSWWPRPGCRRTRRWPCASGCAGCSAASAMPCACLSAASRSRASACCSALPPRMPELEALAELEAALDLRDGAGAALCRRARAASAAPCACTPTAACRPSCWPVMPRRRAGCSSCCSRAQPAAAYGRALLAARRQPPQPVAPRSRQVCACHDVSEERHRRPSCAPAQAMPAQRLQQLQAQLRCGTECGSCLPALKVLVRQHGPQEALAP